MSILNVSRNLPTLKNALNRIAKVNNNAKWELPNGNGGGYYNCWGFVAFTYGWIAQPAWINRHKMEKLLDENSFPVDKPQIGDIAVFRAETDYYDRLTHTAIVSNKNITTVLHKPGEWDLEHARIDFVEHSGVYGYGFVYEFRRPWPKE